MSDGIRFPVPTIAATLPQSARINAESTNSILLYTIPEDEWRQEEFLNLSWQPVIEKELASIRAICPDNAVPLLYPRMHLRKLSGLWGIRLDHIQQYLKIPEDSWRCLSFAETGEVIVHSFAVQFGHSLLYGHQQGGITETLCLRRHYFLSDRPTETDLLSRFVSYNNCCLVDWCWGRTLLPSTLDFKEYFL